MKWDAHIHAFWEKHLGRQCSGLIWQRMTLPRRDGGLGVQTAKLRRDAAFVGAFETSLPSIAESLGICSAAEFAVACPRLVATLRASGAALAQQQQSNFQFSLEACFTQAFRSRQNEHMLEIHKANLTTLLGELSELDRADLRSAGGQLAGAFLETPPDGCNLQIPNAHFRTAVRRRLCMPHPGFEASPSRSSPSTQCKHYATRARGINFCGADLDRFGRHAGGCLTQGLHKIWHNHIRDWLVTWISEQTSRPVLPEPKVPEWNYPQDGRTVEAQLDGGFSDRRGGLVYFDVSVVSATTPGMDAAVLRNHAATDGGAAARGVQAKRRKYPPEKHPRATLVPFVLEGLGRPSEQALDLLRSVAPTTMSARAIAIRGAYYELSTLLALRQAELLLSAEGGHTEVPR